MKRHQIISEDLKLVLKDDPFSVSELTGLNSKKKFCRNGSISFVVRSPLHISDAAVLDRITKISSNVRRIELVISDEENKHKAFLAITSSGKGIRFKARIKSPEIVWLAECRMTGFDFDNVIIPALGGQMLTKDMTPETTLSYKYPFWWNAQFVIGESDPGGIWMHTTDSSPSLKLLRVKKTENDFQLVIGFENDAPLAIKNIETEWFIDSYRKSWKEAVDSHRSWLEKEFSLKPLHQNPFLPEWAHKIDFVFEPWGMRKDQPEPHHTFEQIISRINEFKKFHDPEKTLLYIPGFAENGIDSHAPDYHPALKCGGSGKFRQLMDTAHSLGYKVMLHTNVLAFTFNHPLYKQFEKFRVVDVFNRELGWAMDIDGDWLPEEYFAYMNPGYKEWGDYMVNVIGDLISRFKADAIFLDQTLLAFNVSRGPNFLRGMREHIQRLQNEFPKTLFAGEGLNEQVLPALPFAQIHGIDSLTEVHGMEGRKKWRKVHPVSAYLFSKYTRFTAHLLTKYPEHPMFKFQEDAYGKLDVIPALCLYDYRQKIDTPGLHRMIKRSARLSGNKIKKAAGK